MISCPHCRGTLDDDGTLSGAVACPRCGGQFTIGRSRPAPPGMAIRTSGNQRRGTPGGFFAWVLKVLDLQFKHYWTPTLIKWAWFLFVLMSLLAIGGALLMLVSPAVDENPVVSRPSDFGSPPTWRPPRFVVDASFRIIATCILLIGIAEGLIAFRVICEFLIVIFDIADTLKRIEKKPG